MKKRSRFVVFNLLGLMLIAFSGGLFAGPGIPGAEKTRGLGLDVGYVVPSEENFDETFAFSLNFFYSLSKKFRLELKGSFFPIKVQYEPEGLTEGTLNMIPLQLTLQYRLRISRRFIPYVGVGVGYYVNRFSIENNNEWQRLGFNINEEVDNVFGYHLGAGIDYFLKSRMALYIDFRYCFASLTGNYSITEEVSGISHQGTIEGDINHIFFGAGIKFLF